MLRRFLGATAIALLCSTSSVLAQTSGLAPADEYFGRYNMSVLGIANSIRDAGKRADEGSNATSMLNGPLAFAADAVRAWEAKYPSDPWIPRDLLALESVYVRIHTDASLTLAVRTQKWLASDYPRSEAAEQGRLALDEALGGGSGNAPSTPGVSAWTRFADLRAPLPPH